VIALFAEAPALPLHTAGPYVAAAYIVFLLVVLVYVWIMARKLARNTRDLRDLRSQIEEHDSKVEPASDMAAYRAPSEVDAESLSAEKGATSGGAETL
jgi:HAMP domain-containing protein